MNWDLVWSSFGPLITGAVTGTIPLTLMSFAFGLVLALFVALLRLSPNVVLSGIGR
ncbi:amino acid ABC transporter permease, partial [Paenarthrobacter nicotinovorans]